MEKCFVDFLFNVLNINEMQFEYLSNSLFQIFIE